MACTSVTLSGIALDCGNIGGIKNIWLINNNELVVSSEGGELFVGYKSDKTLSKYSFRKGNASMSSTGTRDDKNGTYFVKTDLSMQFNKMDKGKRSEIANLAKTNCYAIVEDNNGTIFLLGKDEYVALVTANGQSGSVMSDANMYSLVLSADTKELPDTVVSGRFKLLSDFDVFYGLRHDSGDLIALTVTNTPVTDEVNTLGYVVRPDNVIIKSNSSTGKLAQEYIGESGPAYYYVPKSSNLAEFEVAGSGTASLKGNLNCTTRVKPVKLSSCPSLSSIYLPQCTDLVANVCINCTSVVVSPLATNINVYSQYLSNPKWIGDMIKNAFMNNISNFNLICNGGSNNATFFTGAPNNVETYLQTTYGINLNLALGEIFSIGGFIAFNN